METTNRSLALAGVVLMLALLLALALVGGPGGLAPARADPGTLYVDWATGSDDSDCTNPADPCDTVGYALDQAAAGDEILIAEGTYVETLPINRDVSLLGGYEAAGWTRDIAAHPTVLDANGADNSVIVISPDNEVTLEGLIVQGANHVGIDAFGGILIDRSTVVVSGTVVQDNQAADNGGGIYIQDDGESASLTVIRSSILNNHTAANGGGIYASGQPTVTLEYVVVQGNEAVGEGGGLAADAVTIHNSQIVSNTSSFQGGGIFGRVVHIYDSEISYNEVSGVGELGDGGLSIHGFQPELHLENSLVRHNRAVGTVSSGASAIGISNGLATIVNSRISDNESSEYAVALWSSEFAMTNTLIVDNDGNAVVADEVPISGTMMNVTIAGNGDNGLRFTAADVQVTNSILWGNGGQDNNCAGNYTITYSDIGTGDATGMNNISENPRFVDGPGGDYHLLPGSPCTDAGTPAGAPAGDIEGTPRDARPDMGAYEWVGSRVFLPMVVRNYDPPDVHVLVPGVDQAAAMEEATQAFQADTGINVVFEGVENFEEEIVQRAQKGDLPDLAMFPQPGLLGDLVAGGYTIDLNAWFTPVYFGQQYEQSWLDMATMDGQMAGVWYKVSVKSLVWYPVPEFQDAGYQIPGTWVELLALSDQMVADGRTPWCVGIESGPASGWVGTDWVEDIMLRTTTAENYDRWVEGDLLFASPEVKNAFQIMGNVWFSPNYVLGGRAAINTTHFGDAPVPMFDDPPSCWLHRQASFIPGFFPGGTQYGVDYDYFPLPSIDAQYGDPVLIAGDLFGVFQDRPKVRTFVEYLTTGESVRWWVEQGELVSPHKDADPAWYQDTNRGYADMIANADTVRFDGSDLMPGEVGAGTFWKGVVDYVDGVDLDTILSDIDTSWP